MSEEKAMDREAYLRYNYRNTNLHTAVEKNLSWSCWFFHGTEMSKVVTYGETEDKAIEKAKSEIDLICAIADRIFYEEFIKE